MMRIWLYHLLVVTQILNSFGNLQGTFYNLACAKEGLETAGMICEGSLHIHALK